MRKNKNLASGMAVALAVAMLAGTSAFAESRPSEETGRRGEARDRIRRDRAAERQPGDETRNGDRQRDERETWRGDARREEGRRGEPRGRFERDDSYREEHRSDSRYGRRDPYRNDSRYGRGYHHRGTPYYHRGPVTRYRRHGNGYHVWLGGARYPFFVPHTHWHRDRFRVGVVLELGGWYNRRGYYDYYDGYSYRSTSRGELRGTVESVDYRRDTFVIRNDATGSFVTVISRDRRARDVRPGDYVELSGSWTRSGLFNAYDVDLLDYGYRDRW